MSFNDFPVKSHTFYCKRVSLCWLLTLSNDFTLMWAFWIPCLDIRLFNWNLGLLGTCPSASTLLSPGWVTANSQSHIFQSIKWDENLPAFPSPVLQTLSVTQKWDHQAFVWISTDHAEGPQQKDAVSIDVRQLLCNWKNLRKPCRRTMYSDLNKGYMFSLVSLFLLQNEHMLAKTTS